MLRKTNSPGAHFDIHYGQCWEDADILLSSLAIEPGQVCVSIGSAGDNTLAMLSRGPQQVIAVDHNPAQLACLELRVAAFRELEHPQMLELMGAVASTQRRELYRRCRGLLSVRARQFWDAHPSQIDSGIGNAGRFERYLGIFRRRVLPLVHPRSRLSRLLEHKDRQAREAYYRHEWDTPRWRLLFRVFFSRFIMSRLGRERAYFQYVKGSVAERVLERSRYALTVLDPAANPYLRWIMTGSHGTILPFAWRAENYGPIRANLNGLSMRCCSLEKLLETLGKTSVDRFNLSDVFEYMSAPQYRHALEQIVTVGRKNARLAYWNLFVARHRPGDLAECLRPLERLAKALHQRDKTFFYGAFVLEEVICG